MNLVLKNLKRIKLVIYKWVTLIDFVVLLFYCSFITLVYYTMNSLPLWVKIIVIIILGIFGLLLVLEVKYRRKGYQFLWLIFKYWFSNKSYNSKGKNNPKLLVPYQKIKGRYVTVSNSFKRDKKVVNQVVLGIKLEGFNISLLEDHIQSKHMEAFANALRTLEKDCSLVKLEKSLNLKNQQVALLNYGENVKQLYEKKLMTFKAYNARVQQLADYYQTNNLLETLPELSESNWYLLIYGYDDENLINQAKLFINQINIANINCEILTGIESTKVLYNIYYPQVDLDVANIKEHQQILSKLFAYHKAKFNRNNLQVNDNVFLHIHNIFEYPLVVSNRWLEQLSMLKNSTIVLNINRIGKYKQKKQLEKARNILETNLLGTSKQISQKEILINIDQINNLMDAVASGVEELIDTNLLIMTYGNSYEQLISVDYNLRDLCKVLDFKLDSLIYQQFDGLGAIVLKQQDPLFKTNGVEMPISTLGASYPFVTNNLNDSTGLFLGTGGYDNPIFFDQSVRDKKRKNSNQLIIGTSGSGKSFLAKKELNWQISTGKKVIIIDPEREYQQLAKYHDGVWIDVGKSTKGKINPLQIFNNLEDDNEDPLTAHLQFLEEFLELACGGLNRNEKVQLMKLIFQLYENASITRRTDFNSLKANMFPIMNDLYNLAQKEYEKTQQLIFKDLSLILSRFATGGIDAKLWNGYSTIEHNNNFLLVFDLYTLTETGNKRIINAQIFLILKYIESQVRKNKNWNEAHPNESPRWISVTVDEAHLLIDKKYPSALYFMFSMIKRIRKYNGMMNIITQNINDFVGDDEIKRETTAIINGVQYLKCLQLSPHDLTALEQLYSSYGGISEIEKNSISRFNVGELLFSLGGHHRMELTINVSEVEKEAIVGIKKS
ncbi:MULTISPECIES: Mbov_0397 family ICE element conjugal transfer ATPase [unclassified Spiroplasma]|uniref:Mbov_0397 family ICE element conjugal transfer ATPase n=1 Tax=unclassified Spiroplasma TaxID=2637901 RepID=UPI00313BDE21